VECCFYGLLHIFTCFYDMFKQYMAIFWHTPCVDCFTALLVSGVCGLPRTNASHHQYTAQHTSTHNSAHMFVSGTKYLTQKPEHPTTKAANDEYTKLYFTQFSLLICFIVTRHNLGTELLYSYTVYLKVSRLQWNNWRKRRTWRRVMDSCTESYKTESSSRQILLQL
jgi:hypothetical protein